MKYILLFWLALPLLVAAQPAPSVWSNHVDNMNLFSSPRCADLNNDGIKDVVVGGGYELEPMENCASAFDGATGEVLWQIPGRGQLFGSAIFNDITNDNIPEIYINGRASQLKCINGATGELIWQFLPLADTIQPALNPNWYSLYTDLGWYNFYNLQLIDDVDNDNVKDILAANGGNHIAPIFDTINRVPGNLMILSGDDGEIITMAQVPDGRETYMSPIIRDIDNDGILDIIYGTGGENLRGGLWRTTLPDLLAGDISTSTMLMYTNPKGFIAPPMLADFNLDGTLDIVVCSYNGHTVAFDGETNQQLWDVTIPLPSSQRETNSTPTIGQYTDDQVPDVFTTINHGIAPSLFTSIQLMINGATGQIEWQDTLGFIYIGTATSIDYDLDGKDEVIIPVNQSNGSVPNMTFSTSLKIIDFNDGNTIIPLTSPSEGFTLISTPWIGDLDEDQHLDILIAQSTNPTDFVPHDGYSIKRYELNSLSVPEYISCGAYMGTNFDGYYYNPSSGTCAAFQPQIDVTNTCNGANNGRVFCQINGGTAPFIVHWNNATFPPSVSEEFSLQGLSAGNYDLLITDVFGCSFSYEVSIAPSTPILIQGEVSPVILVPSNSVDGSITLNVSGGVSPYTYIWNTGATSNILANISSPEEYSVTVTDQQGCQKTASFFVFEVGVNSVLLPPTQLYPNPAQGGIAQIYIPAAYTELSVYTLTGERVSTQFIVNSGWTTLDLSQHPKGLYMVEMTDAEKRYFAKLMIP